MGGKPYPAGVARVVELLDTVATCDEEIGVLRDRISTDTEKLKSLSERRFRAWDEYRKLMKDMDVSSEGHFGFEGRAGWFLAEMRRQLRAAATSFGPPPMAADRLPSETEGEG